MQEPIVKLRRVTTELFERALQSQYTCEHLYSDIESGKSVGLHDATGYLDNSKIIMCVKCGDVHRAGTRFKVLNPLLNNMKIVKSASGLGYHWRCLNPGCPYESPEKPVDETDKPTTPDCPKCSGSSEKLVE